MSDASGGWPNFDFNIIAEPIQTLHQFAFGHIGEVPTHHAGDLRLSESHPYGCGLLGEPLLANRSPDLDHQPGLDLERIGIW